MISAIIQLTTLASTDHRAKCLFLEGGQCSMTASWKTISYQTFDLTSIPYCSLSHSFMSLKFCKVLKFALWERHREMHDWTDLHWDESTLDGCTAGNQFCVRLLFTWPFNRKTLLAKAIVKQQKSKYLSVPALQRHIISWNEFQKYIVKRCKYFYQTFSTILFRCDF